MKKLSKKGAINQIDENTTKAGYLYVLIHPSDQNLYKVGQTTRQPEERLAEHNSGKSKYTAQVVKETGQKWELKTYISVPDPVWAENAFWAETGLTEIPYRRGIEVENMDWETVQNGLEAAKNAGLRPPPDTSLPYYIYANRAWMNKRLKGRGIALLGHIKAKGRETDFSCSNGHKWCAIAQIVAMGAGCPKCGLGEMNEEEIREATKVGILCLLKHPDKPGVIKIELTYRTREECEEEEYWDGWKVHYCKNFFDEADLAESLLWKSLGCHQPNDNKEIKIDFSIAKRAFRDLYSLIQRELAMTERAKGNVI